MRWARISDFLDLRRLEDRVGEILADLRRQLTQQRRAPARDACRRPAGSRGRTRHCPRTASSTRPARGPRGSSSRRDRQVAAVDRRAAGGIGDLQPVAEQLREQLEIRRLAAAGAGAGELEQRLEELHAAHVGEIDARAIVDRQRLEEGDVGALAVDQRRLVGHVDGLDARLARADRRAGLDAEAAAGAVLDIELQREAGVRIAARVDRRRLEASAGAAASCVLVVVLARG